MTSIHKHGALSVIAKGDREVVITRGFKAPKHLVFEALTKPEYLRRWLGQMPGWTFPVCEVDLRVGGKYRYEWQHEGGMKMGMGGVYREITAPTRLVATEKFDDAWYPGGAICTQALSEEQGFSLLTQTMLYDSKEARDAVLASPMEHGLKAGFDVLASLVER